MPTITNKSIYVTGRNAVGMTGAGAAISAAGSTVACACTPVCVGLECLDRTRFFAGQLLTEADLNNEQSYWLAKSRLHNRLLHGWGVVCGMQVVCSECEGWVTVKTGYAIDPCGNDIIVCTDQPFNVIKAIQTCCAPAPQTANCSPLRYTPSPTCQDAQQQWCVTIQYQEQQTRMVAPLQQTASCCQGQTSSSSSAPTGACEPTRIVEGFQIGLIPAPQTTASTQGVTRTPPVSNPAATLVQLQQTPAPGTFAYEFALCYGALRDLLLQNLTVTGQQPAPAYQTTCSYLASAQNALSASYITHCRLESLIDNITIRPPPSDQNDGYVAGLQEKVNEITGIIRLAALDCFCASLVPPCPPDPCDNRLILACVTVQNGKIVNICHFGCRRQVVTFPMLYYCLSLFGFDQILADLNKLLELICCGEDQQRQGVFSVNTSARDNLTSAGVSNPGMLNRIVMSFAAQKFGAAAVNAASATPNSMDLRPLVGQTKETVLQALRTYADSHNIRFTTPSSTDVSSDPTWTDDAVASSAKYAPAAFNFTQPLTVFTKGDLVVGIDVTNPTDVLQAQVAELQKQVSALTEAMQTLQPQAGSRQGQPQQGSAGAPPEK